jgi:hypothetical protein
MNYRRGLHRLYVVFAAAWFLLVLFMVAAERWLWAPWHVLPATWHDQFGGIPVDAPKAGDWGAVKEEPIPPPPSGFEKPPSDALDGMLSHMPKVKPSARPTRSVLRKAGDVAALSLPLPILGYVLLFWVGPWVYRGFRTQ